MSYRCRFLLSMSLVAVSVGSFPACGNGQVDDLSKSEFVRLMSNSGRVVQAASNSMVSPADFQKDTKDTATIRLQEELYEGIKNGNCRISSTSNSLSLDVAYQPGVPDDQKKKCPIFSNSIYGKRIPTTSKALWTKNTDFAILNSKLETTYNVSVKYETSSENDPNATSGESKIDVKGTINSGKLSGSARVVRGSETTVDGSVKLQPNDTLSEVEFKFNIKNKGGEIISQSYSLAGQGVSKEDCKSYINFVESLFTLPAGQNYVQF